MTDLLSPHQPWADRLHVFDSLPSTNTYLKTLAAQGAPHGTAVLARTQTGGRGRMGRSFSSPEGQGVYLSVLLRPQCRVEALMHLTCAVAVAMTEAVREAVGITPDIKWVNDLMMVGKKLGGILTELTIDREGYAESAIVGVGINCLQDTFPPELKEIATSLKIATGSTVLPDTLAAHMLTAFSQMSLKKSVMDTYRQRCITLGKEILLIQGDAQRTGTALDVTDDGGLLVLFPDGHKEIIASGEASVRNP